MGAVAYDGVTAASSDRGAPLVVGGPTVLEFLVINFSVCVGVIE